MSLQRYVLRKDELVALDDLFSHLRNIKDDEGKRGKIIDYVRIEFKSMLEAFGIYDMAPYQLSRTLSKPSKAKTLYSLLLYHYTVNNLKFDIKYRFHTSVAEDVVKGIDRILAASRKADEETRAKIPVRKISKQPYVSIDHAPEVDNHFEEVPGHLCKKYFGYRRSSTLNGIIRFYISIEPFIGDRRRVYFVNKYVRRDIKWTVRGVGLYINHVLYLYGHAQGEPGGESLGLRFFALRPFENTDILIGPVMTMNQEEPIGARIVLIPISRHNEDFSDVDRLVDKLLARNAQAKTRKQVLEDIFPPLDGAFAGVHPKATAQTLIQLIRNGTFTVLKGRPDWSSEQAYEICDKHAKLVDEFQSRFETELELKKVHNEILERRMKREDRRKKRLVPGSASK
ncbi:MAG: hypothetical protein QOF14_2167 [Hyphomicrobiales bacterium]|jgi:hypothetical protein|nr:hypothetical protein [Hyphomicrobiales bacterium]